MPTIITTTTVTTIRGNVSTTETKTEVKFVEETPSTFPVYVETGYTQEEMPDGFVYFYNPTTRYVFMLDANHTFAGIYDGTNFTQVRPDPVYDEDSYYMDISIEGGDYLFNAETKYVFSHDKYYLGTYDPKTLYFTMKNGYSVVAGKNGYPAPDVWTNLA
jgi:hypothetical protein